MEIKVNQNAHEPLYYQIYSQIRYMILSGQMADGAYLPSERALANQLNVHRNTVIKAYNELKDAGLIDSRQGVGYAVSYKVTDYVEPEVRRKVNWRSVIKDEYQDLEHDFDDMFLRFVERKKISFSSGISPAIYDRDELADEIAGILTEASDMPFYLTPYQGDLDLRRKISAYLRSKGIKADSSQIQIVAETNQALDFIITAMLKPGDRVIAEEPVSPDVFRVIELAGCKVIPVPVDEEGMICDNLEGLIEQNKPKFIYVNSSYHDPTGVMLSIERRRKLLELSNKYRLPIIEEDSASDLSFEEKFFPTLKSMDKSDNVIYIYSFALTFIPGMSLAFVVGPDKLIKAMSYLVSVRIMNLDWLTQKLLLKYIAQGKYAENVRRIREINKTKRDIMCSYLNKLLPLGVEYKKPKGGVYIWCKLPNNMDCREFCDLLSDEGVAITPGTLFYPDSNSGYDYIRLNYSYESEERIHKGMQVLTRKIKELVCKNTE